MRALRFGLFVAGFVLACSKSPTSSPGPLGTVDLKQRLPPGVVAPADGELESREAHQGVCGASTPSGSPRPGFENAEPADIVVRWKTFKGADRDYIASYAVDVVKPSSGTTLKLGDTTSVGPTPNDPRRTFAEFDVHCLRTSGSLEVDDHDRIVILSDGTSTLRK
jgi:hypothetical protein